MPLPTDEKALNLSKDLLHALDNLAGGEHPGFRPVHAKGVMLTGTFTPAPDAASLTSAPHMQANPTPVTVRLSDFAGIPTVPDNDPQGASPRGCAIRFHLGEHVHTDIVSHSVDSFPTRTAEEFLEFARTIAATDFAGPHPNAFEQYLGAHPKALAFVQLPKPIPTSLAKESYFAVNAFKFTDAKGTSRFVRYRVLPVEKNEYLDENAAAGKTPNFLFEEIADRVAQGPVKFKLVVQLAEQGDTVDDATVRWPEDRKLVTLGEISLTTRVPDNDEEARRIIFDPIPRVDGIESSGDPLLQPRADVYLLSGRRRRAATQK